MMLSLTLFLCVVFLMNIKRINIASLFAGHLVLMRLQKHRYKSAKLSYFCSFVNIMTIVESRMRVVLRASAVAQHCHDSLGLPHLKLVDVSSLINQSFN